MQIHTKVTTAKGTVEVYSANGEARITIENHEGDGLIWTLDSTGFMHHSPQALASTTQLDPTALHLKAVFEGLQSLAAGDLEM